MTDLFTNQWQGGTMTYLIQKHACGLPTIEVHGDIWKCDICGRVWRAIAPGNPEYNTWRCLGPIGRRIWLRGVS